MVAVEAAKLAAAVDNKVEVPVEAKLAAADNRAEVPVVVDQEEAGVQANK